MGFTRFTHAKVSATNPRALAVCDRCGSVYNHDRLNWQYQWQGPQLENQYILVCPSCMDVPQEQLRTIILPPDPVPIENPRPGEFSFQAAMESSSPNFGTITLSVSSVALDAPVGTVIGTLAVTSGVSTSYFFEMSSDASGWFGISSNSLIVDLPPNLAGDASIIVVANSDSLAPLITQSFTIAVS